MCCGCDTSYIVSFHIQSQASIYTLSLCRGHSWRVRLAKQETLTPPGHLVSPLVYRGPWMSTVVLYCWCHSDSALVLLYFTFSTFSYIVRLLIFRHQSLIVRMLVSRDHSHIVRLLNFRCHLHIVPFFIRTNVLIHFTFYGSVFCHILNNVKSKPFISYLEKLSVVDSLWYFSSCFRTLSLRVKAVSHDATSLMRFGFIKLVSPCDRAKTCRKRLLKVPCDCFYNSALLFSCNLFRATFPYQQIRFSIISVQWGKTNFYI